VNGAGTAGLVLFGGGGHGRAVADVARRRGFAVAAVADPAAPGPGRDEAWAGAAALAGDDRGIAHALEHGLGGLLGVGDNAARGRLAARLEAAGVPLPVLVARTATVAPDARLGPGTVVLEHAHVGPGAVLGPACVVNTAAVVEHDAVLDAAVHCAPGAVLTGGVRCAAGVLVGAGAVVLPCRTAGAGATIGAGAVVTRDVAPGATVRGPAAGPAPATPPAPVAQARVEEAAR